MHDIFRKELEESIPNKLWQKLGHYIDGLVRLHTINVLVCVVRAPTYRTLPKHEQNILKWAALFHDISKRGPPEFDGRDHVHPFNSAAAMLEVFHEMGILALRDDQERENF